jgi:hypothetical protein
MDYVTKLREMSYWLVLEVPCGKVLCFGKKTGTDLMEKRASIMSRVKQFNYLPVHTT